MEQYLSTEFLLLTEKPMISTTKSDGEVKTATQNTRYQRQFYPVEIMCALFLRMFPLTIEPEQIFM